MSGHDHEEEQNHHEPTYGTPILVFIGLVALTCITVSSTVIKLSATASVLLAMTVATIKATLVVYFFMHLKYEKKYLGLFFGIPVIILVIIFLWTFTDYPFRVYN